MKKLNGSAAWVRIGLYVIVTVAAVAIAWGSLGYAVRGNTKDINVLTPKVEAHGTYIDGDRVATEYIKRDIAEIRRTQSVILEEVRALK